MIILKELKITDFLSHESTEITFKENDKFSIDGESGAGKSAIAEAITWGLYGRGRSDNKSLIRKNSKTASVFIKMEEGEVETCITRTITTSGKNTLSVTQNTGSDGQFIQIGRTGIKDTQAWITEEFLRSSYELFTNSIVYKQDGTESFINANAGRRKDLLLEIIRAGNFDDLYTKTRNEIGTREIEAGSSLMTISDYEQKISRHKEKISKKASIKDSVDLLIAKIDKDSVVKNELEKKLAAISNLSKEKTDALQLKNALEASITALSESLSSHKSVLAEHNSVDIETHKKNAEKIAPLEKKIKEVESRMQLISETQNKRNKLFANKPTISDFTKDIENINKRLIPLVQDSGKCPSGDKCPFVVPIKGQIDYLSDQITEKEKQTRKEEIALDSWSKELALLPKEEDISSLYSEITSMNKDISELLRSKEIVLYYEKTEEKVEDINKKVSILENDISLKNKELIETERLLTSIEEKIKTSNVNEINISLSEINTEIRNKQKEKDESVMELKIIEISEEELKDLKKSKKEIETSIKIINEEIESLSLLKEALSPRGIKAVVIDYLVPQLEDKINNILSQMSDFRIRLDTQAPKSDEGLKEGLFIIVRNDVGEELPISNLSGGETVKVSMAISEALAGLMNIVGFRVLDECVNALDSESTESFVSVILKLQKNFPQVFVISHLNEVKDIFSSKLRVRKVNGVSRLE